MKSTALAPSFDTQSHHAPAPAILSIADALMPQARATYRTRLATNAEDMKAAQRLRFEVFNVELGEGLSESWRTQLDSDRFDTACDHLIIEHIASGKIVGTYRLQTGEMAAGANGYYSEQEFDFTPFERIRSQIVELGRACVHQEHRKGAVLDLLWRGIASYTRERRARYLIGCSSLTSQDPAVGHAMYARLAADHLASEKFRTKPLASYALPDAEPLAECPKPPRLLRTYLTVGAKICGAPALDREFGTIDFLTLIDLTSLPAAASARFLS
jgi:putative hemolysin